MSAVHRLLALAALCAAPPAAVPRQLWTSPDGRFAAAFPSSPELISVESAGGSGSGYRSVSRGLICLLTITAADAAPEPPRESQVRDTLTRATEALIAYAGGDLRRATREWRTFGKGIPRLDHRFRYSRDGTEFESVGFLMFVGNEMIRVSSTFATANAKGHREAAVQFVRSFAILSIGPETVPGASAPRWSKSDRERFKTMCQNQMPKTPEFRLFSSLCECWLSKSATRWDSLGEMEASIREESSREAWSEMFSYCLDDDSAAYSRLMSQREEECRSKGTPAATCKCIRKEWRRRWPKWTSYVADSDSSRGLREVGAACSQK